MDKSDRNDGHTSSKRFGSTSSHGRNNPFNAVTPLSTSGISSPTTGASGAFGLGSGAFASFGSATKTPKTPGTAFDFAKAVTGTPSTANSAEKKEGEEKKSFARKGSNSGKNDQKTIDLEEQASLISQIMPWISKDLVLKNGIQVVGNATNSVHQGLKRKHEDETGSIEEISPKKARVTR